jgi:hypothetical protein
LYGVVLCDNTLAATKTTTGTAKTTADGHEDQQDLQLKNALLLNNKIGKDIIIHLVFFSM